MFKLKTAQIDEETEFATAAEEIAAIVTDPRYPDRLEAYEMRTADGELIRLEMPRRQAREVLAELEDDYQKMANSDPMIVAGPHCVTCKVADLCDAFPRLDEGAEKINPPKKRKPSAFRLMISKSRLPEMDYCERRAAWRLWFSIPPDQDHYSQEISPGLAVGNRFHHLMAKALLSDEPASVFSGDLEMESLYRQHLSLPAHPPSTSKRPSFRWDSRSGSALDINLSRWCCTASPTGWDGKRMARRLSSTTKRVRHQEPNPSKRNYTRSAPFSDSNPLPWPLTSTASPPPGKTRSVIARCGSEPRWRS